MTDWFAANKAAWNERVGVHLRDTSDIYSLDSFARGEDVLGPIEGAEIGGRPGVTLRDVRSSEVRDGDAGIDARTPGLQREVPELGRFARTRTQTIRGPWTGRRINGECGASSLSDRRVARG